MSTSNCLPVSHGNTVIYAILVILLLFYSLTLHHIDFSLPSKDTPNTIFINNLSPNDNNILTSSDYKELLADALRPENRNITIVINSCGRLDLLNQTLTSIMTYWPHDKYPIFEKILVDDCRDKLAAIELINRYYPEYEIVLTGDNAFEKRYINRDERITLAMDKAMKQVRSHWVYHVEDDWRFTRHGFIDDSFDIFETNVDEKYQTGAYWENTECSRFESEISNNASHHESVCGTHTLNITDIIAAGQNQKYGVVIQYHIFILIQAINIRL
eukprot:576997_1